MKLYLLTLEYRYVISTRRGSKMERKILLLQIGVILLSLGLCILSYRIGSLDNRVEQLEANQEVIITIFKQMTEVK